MRFIAKRKVTVISKLIVSLSTNILGRDNFSELVTRIYRLQRNFVNFIKERRTIKILHVFRKYSALIVVISSALLVSATNFSAGKESSGFLFGYFGAEENFDSPLKDKMFVKTSKKTNLVLAPLAETKNSPDPTQPPNEDDMLIAQGQAFEAGNCPVRKDPEEDGGVIIYAVKDGDTVSGIAYKHKISINTLLWANELENVDEIKPGDQIFILPVSGLSYKVKKGDTLDSIAGKYKAEKDKIIAFNSLPANGEIEDGLELIIPDGEREVPRTQITAPGSSSGSFGIAQRPYQSFGSAGISILGGKAGTGHRFPYGYCTWYVASRKYVPWGGNAGTWLYHAKAAGYATGKAPRPGAIMVSSESWWGHVGIVESVSSGSFTISEMNYAGWGKRSTRTIAIGSRVVRGFIY